MKFLFHARSLCRAINRLYNCEDTSWKKRWALVDLDVMSAKGRVEKVCIVELLQRHELVVPQTKGLVIFVSIDRG
jgi:hypothetical protein